MSTNLLNSTAAVGDTFDPYELMALEATFKAFMMVSIPTDVVKGGGASYSNVVGYITEPTNEKKNELSKSFYAATICDN